MAISDYYTSTISRYVATLTDSVFSKNSTKTWAISGPTFKARIETLNADEIIYDESRKPLSTHIGFCANNVTVAYVDRWNDGTNTYEIVSIEAIGNGKTSTIHHYEIGLKLV